MKTKLLKHFLAVALIGLVPMLYPVTAQAASNLEIGGTADVVIVSLSENHSAGANAGAVRNGDSGAALDASLSCPGAWASFTLTVKNRGTATAVLSQVLQQDNTSDAVRLSFGISEADVGEKLSPGDTCTVTIVAEVDPETSAPVLEESGSFSLTLVYDADGSVPEAPPQTGDIAPLLFLCMLMAFFLLACILRKRRTAAQG